MKMSALDDALDKKLGDDWHLMEIETLSLHIGALFDELTMVKIFILKVLQQKPELVLNDVDYFLRFVEACNGNVPDPDHADIPTSIELDFALREVEHILGDRMKPTGMLSNLVRYVVNDEGHGKVASDLLAKYSGIPKQETEFTIAYEKYAKEI